MNWEALGAIGEIVGTVAVVVTLGYLAVQIRQNTRTMRAPSNHASPRKETKPTIGLGSILLLRRFCCVVPGIATNWVSRSATATDL
jgi:hypothetical protein